MSSREKENPQTKKRLAVAGVCHLCGRDPQGRPTVAGERRPLRQNWGKEPTGARRRPPPGQARAGNHARGRPPPQPALRRCGLRVPPPATPPGRRGTANLCWQALPQRRQWHHCDCCCVWQEMPLRLLRHMNVWKGHSRALPLVLHQCRHRHRHRGLSCRGWQAVAGASAAGGLADPGQHRRHRCTDRSLCQRS